MNQLAIDRIARDVALDRLTSERGVTMDEREQVAEQGLTCGLEQRLRSEHIRQTCVGRPRQLAEALPPGVALVEREQVLGIHPRP